MDSSQLALLGDQQFQERSEQAFAPNADVIYTPGRAVAFLAKSLDGATTRNATET